MKSFMRSYIRISPSTFLLNGLIFPFPDDCIDNLKILDLSFNQLSVIENLECLTRLEKLDLRGNRIIDVTNIVKLNCNLYLDSLYLQSTEGSHANPCCRDMNYLSVVREACKALVILDGGHIALESTTQAIDKANQGISPLLKEVLDQWINRERTDLIMKLPDDEDEVISRSFTRINMMIDECSVAMSCRISVIIK